MSFRLLVLEVYKFCQHLRLGKLQLYQHEWLQLEEATTSSFIDELSNDGGRLVQETGNAASETDGINLEGQNSVQTDPYVVETSLNDAATFSRTGSSSGTASVLKGITVAAS